MSTHQHESTRARAREYDLARSSTRLSTHQHSSTRPRARAREHESTSVNTRPRVRGALEHEHGVARQSVRAVSKPACETCRTFFHFRNHVYVSLHAPGWLYVLKMPPRGYLPIFVTLTPRARTTDLGQGPHLRRGVRAGFLLAPEPKARETTRRRKRKKWRRTKTNPFIHSK